MTHLVLGRLDIEPMASGNQSLVLTETIDWEGFPAYAEEIVRSVAGVVIDRADGPTSECGRSPSAGTRSGCRTKTRRVHRSFWLGATSSRLDDRSLALRSWRQVVNGDAKGVRNLPQIMRRRSRICGWGVYAAQPIAGETRIVEYKGELIPQREAGQRERRYLPRQRIWIFTIDNRWARDAAVGGNIARYINHACHPNCYIDIVGHTIWILSSRDIGKGEELTYDYNTDGVAGIPCCCRPGCRRIL